MRTHIEAVFRNPGNLRGVLSLSSVVRGTRRTMAAPGERGWADVTAGIPEIEDEHASLFESPPGVNPGRVMGGHRKSNGAGSRVDTSIRRRPCEDAVRRRRSDRSTGAG